MQTTDNEENRYAVLTYNGIKSQTFVVFDTKLKEIYYKQEDGNSALSSVFDRYNETGMTLRLTKMIWLYILCRKRKTMC